MSTATKPISCLLLCAWILWSQTYIKDTKEGVDIMGAYPNQIECERGLGDLIALHKAGGKEVGPATIKWNKDQTASLICLPDTMKMQ